MTAGYWDDEEREEGILEEAGEVSGGWCSVRSSSGWSCSVNLAYGVMPKVGDAFVTWGSIGRPIRGMAINGHLLYYRTPAEQRVEDAKAAEKHKAERVAEYESHRADFDVRALALPEPFRLRIEGFRKHGGDAWRWSFESYELMCCEQSAKLVERFPTMDALKAFAELGYDEQAAAFPEMDSGHSGNSWGMVKALSRLLIERPDLVPDMHGALCSLVGCEDYGCSAARQQGDGR